MILRPRQEQFVDRHVHAVEKNGDTMGVAPTGAGKTVMACAIGARLGGRTLMLQHRDELVRQNRLTWQAYCGAKAPTATFDAQTKRFSPENQAGCTFAMVQTAARNLDKLERVDTLIIDETHHAGAASYIKVVDRLRDLNSDLKVIGVTATPERGDGRTLRHLFSNVADVITMEELIQEGHLVKPRTFVVDTGNRDALAGVGKTRSGEFDMDQVAGIMDQQPVLDRVLEEWRTLAGQRQTVMFTATVQHAEDMAQTMWDAGITADVIHGKLPKARRASILRRFDKREIQVLCNCAVLTEGWDSQPVSCVVLLRPSSHRSTVIQMCGRGLRTVNPQLYPDVVKDDCIILDFGYSLLNHGNIFDGSHRPPQDGEEMRCPDCGVQVPKGISECPICGHEFPKLPNPYAKTCPDCGSDCAPNQKTCHQCGHEFPEGEGDAPPQQLEDFRMREIRLLDLSPFRWERFFDDIAMVANALNAEAFIVKRNDLWHALGSDNKGLWHIIKTHDRALALAQADDFLRLHGDRSNARKTKGWLNKPATERQLLRLGYAHKGFVPSINRYRAACMLSFKFNERRLEKLTR